MKNSIAIALFFYAAFALGEITITKPNMTLVDDSGKPVEGVTDSTSIEKAMEKASRLPNGTYYLKRPDIKIVVNNNQPKSSEALLTWTSPTKNTDNSNLDNLALFNIYHGLSKEELKLIGQAGLAQGNKFKITGLQSGVNYFAVTAVNSNGWESELSPIVSKTIL